MALLDSLSRRAAEVSAKAIQRTRDFSDITRLNTQISEEEKKQSNLFYQLGKQYYAIHADNCEGEFKSLISSILDSKLKLERLKKQVQDLKGIQRCEKCGAEVEKGAAFCSSCGTPMPSQTIASAEDKVICGKCGAIVKKGLRFCTSCGNLITQPILEELPKFTLKCSNCGADIEPDSQFCAVCGANIIDESK